MESRIHIGTSGWSYKDWLGPFYPPGTKQTEYLQHYATQLKTVEIDSTFYAIPRVTTVENWFDRTPDTFIFSPKAPKLITHDKRLTDCDSDWNRYLQTMQILKQKLGPIVLQFDYKFNFKDHFSILESFLEKHHQDARLCVEIRHKNWHTAEFFEMLRQYNVALVLNDLYYMPRKIELTADFTYIRLLGNRKQIPDDFSNARINRDKDFDWWTEWIRKFQEKELEVFIYSNNRYQGHAPATIRSIQERLDRFSSL